MPLWLLRILARTRPEVLCLVDTDEPVVGLAIVGGPDAAVVETLARHEARATFFLWGSGAAQQPTLLRRIAEAGHELGNAAWDGTPDSDGIMRTQAVLEPLARARFLRTAGWPGRRVREAAERHGLRCVVGSRRAHRGAIVELREPPADALDALLVELRERGLRPTTVTDLVARG